MGNTSQKARHLFSHEDEINPAIKKVESCSIIEEEQELNLNEKVDLITTTLSVKPPKLPLREECRSLGVECVYKAKGVGWNGVKKTSSQMKINHEHDDKLCNIKNELLDSYLLSDLQETCNEEDGNIEYKYNEPEKQPKVKQLRALSYEEYVAILILSLGKLKNQPTDDTGIHHQSDALQLMTNILPDKGESENEDNYDRQHVPCEKYSVPNPINQKKKISPPVENMNHEERSIKCHRGGVDANISTSIPASRQEMLKVAASIDSLALTLSNDIPFQEEEEEDQIYSYPTFSSFSSGISNSKKLRLEPHLMLIEDCDSRTFCEDELNSLRFALESKMELEALGNFIDQLEVADHYDPLDRNYQDDKTNNLTQLDPPMFETNSFSQEQKMEQPSFEIGLKTKDIDSLISDVNGLCDQIERKIDNIVNDTELG